jgi:Isoleucyl-tRNA synthetase (EC 6.1.1.5)
LGRDQRLRETEGEKSDEKFFFVDGPPYTTGNIHLGTAWNKIIKDAILRYKRMDGFSVTDRPGWDMHGLPIEVKVEEELKFKSKKDIERYGVAEFVENCIKFALKQKENMTAVQEIGGVDGLGESIRIDRSRLYGVGVVDA